MDKEKEKNLVLGIDIGGSHITVGFVDLNRRQIIPGSYFRAFVNSRGSAEEILEAWSEVIQKAFSTVAVTEKKISIAMPGPFDYKAGISYIKYNQKYDALYKLNVRELLARKLDIPPRHILMVNDAVCFLKGEIFAGAAVSHNKAIALTLGTGLGTAVYNNGTAIDAGLWNTTLHTGIAEDYISSRWFLKTYFELTGINISNVKALKNISADSATARSIFKQFAVNLSVFLQPFIERENPGIVIIGGNIAKASAWFLPHLVVCLNKENIHVPISITRLGEQAPLLGAASYWTNSRYILEHIIY